MWCSWWIIVVAAVVAVLLVAVIAGVLARCCRRRVPQKPPIVAQYPIRAGSNYAQYGPAYYNGVGSTGEPVCGLPSHGSMLLMYGICTF